MARSYQVSCPPVGKTLIVDSSTKAGGPNVTIRNAGDTTLWIGGDENELPNQTSTVTSSAGFGIAAGATLNLLVSGEEKIYGIGSGTTGTCTAYVFRTNRAH